MKPVNQAMPQALKSSRLLVVHNDAVARGVAHIKEAIKAVGDKGRSESFTLVGQLSPYVPRGDEARDHFRVVSEVDPTLCNLAGRLRLPSRKTSTDDVHAFLWGCSDEPLS